MGEKAKCKIHWRLFSTLQAKEQRFLAIFPCNKLQRNYTVVMEDIIFAWNAEKSSANLRKHGISFDEAKTVFQDELARLIPDPDSALGEERFILIGKSNTFNLLVVCHCYRHYDHHYYQQGQDVIRIISARCANKHERKAYESYR